MCYVCLFGLFFSFLVVEFADMERDEVQYSWNDGTTFHFMNSKTFETISLSKEDCTDWEFLTEGLEVKVQKFKDQVIGVELPKVCEFEVLSTNVQKTRYSIILAQFGCSKCIYYCYATLLLQLWL